MKRYNQPPTKQSDYRLNELVKEVRKLDKSQGLKLKHPVSYMEPEISYGVNLQNARIYFLCIAIVMNKQDPDIYFARNRGFIHNTEKVSIENDFFVANSPLFHFNNTQKYKVDSDEFRGRFITLLCMRVSDILSEIVETRFILSRKKLNEYEQKELILHDVVQIFNNFIIHYAEGHGFEDDLYNVLVLLTISSTRKKRKRNMKIDSIHVIEKQGEQLSDGRMGFMFGKMIMDDDIAINNVIKLAYVAITENPNVSNTPFISDGIRVTDSEDVKELVTALGASINFEYRDKPELYDIFMKSVPDLCFKWRDININLNLNTGCKALAYLDFIYHNKNIHNLINSMLVR